MKHGITSLDMRQESIAQTLSCWGTFDETRNISHIEKGRHFAENKKQKIKSWTMLKQILSRFYNILSTQQYS